MEKIGKERRRRSRITLSWESKLLQLSNEFLAYSTWNFWKIWLMSCSFASIFLVMREETEDQREERKDVNDQFTLLQQPGPLKRGRTKTPCNKIASMCRRKHCEAKKATITGSRPPVRSTGPVTRQKHGLSSAAGHVPGKRFFHWRNFPESEILKIKSKIK